MRLDGRGTQVHLDCGDIIWCPDTPELLPWDNHSKQMVLHDHHTDQFVAVLDSWTADWPLLQQIRHRLPFFCEHLPLTPSPDPSHVTLFYAPTSDLTYQSWFNEQ